VTGAASGLGLASAARFAAEGARVVCVDLEEGAVQTAAEQVGGGAIGVVADVTDAAALEAMVTRALNEFGTVDVLMANAGISGEGMAHELALERWHRVLAVNLTGVFLSVRALLPHFMERRGGSIVATASVAGLAGVPHLPAYAASKGGVIALVRQLAIEYAAWGIRVNAICPSTVPTPLVAEAYRERGISMEARAKRFPLGRMGEPDDVANLALFLASDESSWITGGAHPVDGGMTAALVPRAREVT
jgi:NAD(P)-dependent dehydrogenase (short-subunit alcohol dehydrogenase family)